MMIIEMKCPHCQASQQFKHRDEKPRLTKCHSCKKLLVVQPEESETLHGKTIMLDVLRVESKRKLKEVA